MAWTGLRSPTILWTYALEADAQALDTFFQQHLLMNVYACQCPAAFASAAHSRVPREPDLNAAERLIVGV